MANRSYGLCEIVGTSTESSDDAVRNAVERAAKDTRHIDWFEVVETRGYVRDDLVHHFQVTVKIGYRLED